MTDVAHLRNRIHCGDAMHRLMLAIVAAISALDLTGCENRPQAVTLAMDQEVVLTGQVSSIDATPMFVDGDGLIFLHSNTHGDVVIHIPARERLCRASGLEAFYRLRSGDSIRASGTVTALHDITVCAAESHFLRDIE